MTNQQMIDALSKFPPDDEIRFAIQVPTRAYPSVYVGLESTAAKRGYEYWISSNGGTRIHLHLPDGFTIHERKSKQ